AAIQAGDSEVAELCVRFFNTYLRAAINQSAPTFASAIMNEYRRLAIGALEWRPDLAVEAAAHLLRYGRHFDEAGMPAIYGIAAAPPDFVDAALDRMESMKNGLFWEVNERVIAFDWVEQPLRAEIPRLRAALRRAKASGHGLALELDADPAVAQDLVQPAPTA